MQDPKAAIRVAQPLDKQPRRWAAFLRKNPVADNDITPAEAKIAIVAILAQHGWVLKSIDEYDDQRDLFHLTVRSKNDTVIDVPANLWPQKDVKVPGETIAKVIQVCRGLRDGHDVQIAKPFMDTRREFS